MTNEWRIEAFDRHGKLLDFHDQHGGPRTSLEDALDYVDTYWDSEMPKEAATFTITGDGVVKTYEVDEVKFVRGLGGDFNVWKKLATQPSRPGRRRVKPSA
jgi:hypothetical protein